MKPSNRPLSPRDESAALNMLSSFDISKDVGEDGQGNSPSMQSVTGDFVDNEEVFDNIPSGEQRPAEGM